MRNWIIVAVSMAMLAACGETQTQRTTTGAVGGGTVGALAGGPVGAVVGAGVGAVAGANREKIDQSTDKATAKAEKKISEATGTDKSERSSAQSSTAQSSTMADNTADARSGSKQSGMQNDAMNERNMQSANMPAPTNDQVKTAQVALRDLNLYNGPIDGLYGVKTIRAVNQFQAQKDLARTGTLNERTQRELQMASNADANNATQGSAMSAGSTSGQDEPRKPMPATSAKATE